MYNYICSDCDNKISSTKRQKLCKCGSFVINVDDLPDHKKPSDFIDETEAIKRLNSFINTHMAEKLDIEFWEYMLLLKHDPVFLYQQIEGI